MDFAKQQLEKYGWKDGEGLGRSKNGISKPIKAKLKFDNAGLGHKLSDDIVNPWWQRVYNSAASNVTVEQQNDSVQVTKLDNDVEITTKKRKKKKRKLDEVENKYSNFVKKASLNWKGETPIINGNDSSEEEEEVKKRTSGICDLTDEELFKACGGRTVHKGARHGLSMSAKLARLEEQECTTNLKKKKKKKK